MQIYIIAIGNRMPSWVTEGYKEYAGRMPPECALKLIEIPADKRTKGADLKRISEKEGQRVLEAIPKNCKVIALEIQGMKCSTEKLATQLEDWMQVGRDVALLIGRPEGRSQECLKQAEQHWSLSPMTLPHPMVRVELAEQIYRAWSILKNHPYHR